MRHQRTYILRLARHALTANSTQPRLWLAMGELAGQRFTPRRFVRTVAADLRGVEALS